MSDFYENLTAVNEDSVSRRHWLYGAVAGLAGLGGAGWAWWTHAPSSAPSTAVDALWQLTLNTPAGNPLALASLKGKPLLVNFWATWCPPCVDELPLLDHFYQKNKANGWQVVGIAVDQLDAVTRFLSKMPLQFPVVLVGPSGLELGKSLGNLSGGLPFSIVLGADGDLVHRKIGRVTPDDLSAWASLR